MITIVNAYCWIVLLIHVHLASALRSSTHPTAQSSLQSTAFVLKSYGYFTHWERFLIKDYYHKLSPSNVAVGVLKERKGFKGSTRSLKDYVVRSTIQIDEITVPVCEVSWLAAQREFGTEFLSKFQVIGGEGHPKNGGAHNVYTALWWKYCAFDLANNALQYAWFSESDAFYSGDIVDFIADYSNDNADIIAAGFRIAGVHWWNYHSLDDAIAAGMTTFDVNSRIVRNLATLPTLSEGSCNDGTHDSQGVVFAQDVVVRFSRELFTILEYALSRNMLGPGEAFLPTLCASHGTNCTMMDFAPLLQRDNLSKVSPHFCWYGSPRLEDLCKPEFQGKWIHPLKRVVPEFPSCFLSHLS